MNLQQTAIDSTYRNALAFQGVTVVYRRLAPTVTTTTPAPGDTTTTTNPSSPYAVSLKAIVGKSQHAIDEGEWGVITKQTVDFIVEASTLIINSAVTKPIKGDRIEQTIGDELYIYEVFSPSGNDFYTCSDPEHKWIRVHTQLVDTQ